SAIGLLDETNHLQKNAEQMSIDFALGKINNVHDVMIAQEKASVALQYTVKMKNAVLDAYNEIMRMQF
ncbi:MAG: flagellar hook-basal body complex protein FliE, partial [Vallitaleaceae bacterium]|nr:flagellar hook-basal body complex protein FliE [Vallitaleaceae bacterium]